MFSKQTGGTPTQDAANTSDYVRAIHKHSDVDFSPDSQHHTIGNGEHQAASGADLERLTTRVKRAEARLKALDGLDA